MALWVAKGMGVLFGGVTDDDSDEETLKSVFWNDLYAYLQASRCYLILALCRNGYQVAGNGRWVSMMLKVPRKKGGRRKKDHVREDDDESDEDARKAAAIEPEAGPDPDDPLPSTPIPRYNAMLAVLRNTLYMHVFMHLRLMSEG
jgi:hypothetical protein